MANMNSRDLFPFDESGSTNPVPGGLPGLLQQVMPQWRPPASLLGADPASLLQQPDRAFNAKQLQALARGDQLMQPLSSNTADDGASSPRDPNFRQLVSRPLNAAPRATGDQPTDTPSSLERVALNVPRHALASGERPANDTQARPPEEDHSTANVVPVGALTEALRARGLIAPFRPPGNSIPPSGPTSFPTRLMPELPYAWKMLLPLVKGLPEAMRRVAVGDDDFQKCLKAISGGTEAWEEFCRQLKPGWNNVVAPETVKRACWSKTYESDQNKRNWCENQFGESSK